MKRLTLQDLGALLRLGGREAGTVESTLADYDGVDSLLGGFRNTSIRPVVQGGISALPRYIPVIYSKTNRLLPLQREMVAVPLWRIIGGPAKSYDLLVDSEMELREKFLIAKSTKFVVIGAGFDSKLENFWCNLHRSELLARLPTLGVTAVTTPNYSYFTDMMGPTKMYNFRRILVATQALADAGVSSRFFIVGGQVGLSLKVGQHTVYLYGMLAPCQNKLVGFMRRHLREKGVMPSTAEIQEEFDYSSPGTVTTHLEGLRRNGVLKPNSGKHRGLQFTTAWQPRETRDVPFLGSIPAGYPEGAELQTDQSVAFDVATFGVSPSASLFALKVRGDSMENAGILDGDTVILEHNIEPKSGEIVAALIDGQTTLKRFMVQRKQAFLRAENPRYQDIIPARELSIQGVYRGLLRIFRR